MLEFVWVTNRENPLTDSSWVLKLNETGVLLLLNHDKSVIWSSNTTRPARYPVAKLLDSGNFIVQDGNNNNDPKYLLWQSFDYPVDTILPGQKFGRNLITGLNLYLSSWNSSDDPSQGSVKRYRFGSWNGIQFSGAPQLKQSDVSRFNYTSNEEELYYTFELVNKSAIRRMVLTTDGYIQGIYWHNEGNEWSLYTRIPLDDCDYYDNRGAYASCNINKIPACNCLDGFVPKTVDIYSGSCVMRTSFSSHGDGVLKFSGLKLPDTERPWVDRNISLEDCRILCMKNCSCTAYAALDVSKGPSGCLLWFNELIDTRELTEVDEDIYIRMAGTEIVSFLLLLVSVFSYLLSFLTVSQLLFLAGAIERKQLHKSNLRKQETVIIRKMKGNLERDASLLLNEHEKEDLELPMFELSTITFTTNNFSPDNKLGEGGFGSVYKGILDDGRETAVKRFSTNSGQGLQEFKNEVTHIAKLQHRNLVRLLGYCTQAGKRLLVYEFLPNKCLDFFIFSKIWLVCIHTLCIMIQTLESYLKKSPTWPPFEQMKRRAC
ncbi:G-type lectin S-receptor-like serine/threonine-protein kinase, partial [Mucuna pruriens]